MPKKPAPLTGPGAPSVTRLDLLVSLLSHADGTTIGAMAEATGWQHHSVRGAMASALKKRGHAIVSDKTDGIRRYRIVPA